MAQTEKMNRECVESASFDGDVALTYDWAPAPAIQRRGIEWVGGVAGRPLIVTLTFENPTRRPTLPRVA